MRIIIDTGHGINTPGKRSPVWSDGTQLIEWEWTRKVGAILANMLYIDGIPYDILVPEIEDISLSERCRRANKIYSNNENKDTYLISIHANAYKPNKAEGWEIWTSVGESKSDLFAEYIYKEAEKILPFKFRKDTTDGDSDKEKDFTILYGTDCPAVLSENGFMDNENDCKYMLSEKGMTDIANAHLNAIWSYIHDTEINRVKI